MNFLQQIDNTIGQKADSEKFDFSFIEKCIIGVTTFIVGGLVIKYLTQNINTLKMSTNEYPDPNITPSNDMRNTSIPCNTKILPVRFESPYSNKKKDIEIDTPYSLVCPSSKEMIHVHVLYSLSDIVYYQRCHMTITENCKRDYFDYFAVKIEGLAGWYCLDMINRKRERKKLQSPTLPTQPQYHGIIQKDKGGIIIIEVVIISEDVVIYTKYNSYVQHRMDRWFFDNKVIQLNGLQLDQYVEKFETPDDGRAGDTDFLLPTTVIEEQYAEYFNETIFDKIYKWYCTKIKKRSIEYVETEDYYV